MRKQLLLIVLALGAIQISSCTKEVEEPLNPYDSIDYGTNENPDDTLNPSSITGLHRNVFLPKCAVPGCHDGNFEPDFRSVQSSYSTLVYSEITKNNENEDFKFRVVPGDTSMSVLHERITNCCFVNQDDRMPQDNIGTGLPQADINNVSNWIMGGAKAPDGSIPERPDLQPLITFYFAVNTTFNIEYSTLNNRVDSIIFNPFKLPADVESFYFVAAVEDDITPIPELLINQLKISTNIDDFSNAQNFTGQFFSNPANGDQFWLITVTTENLTAGETYFMRYQVNDGNHTENAEFPTNSTIEPYKTYWSFIVEP
ncbi:MAG: hypothetical protein WED33_06175 [Bacteroidia bacterium]